MEGDAAAIFGSPIFDPFQKPHFKPRVGMRGPFDYPECLHLTYVFLFEIEHSFILQVCTSWFRFVSCSIFSLCENRLLRVSKNISKHFQKHFQKYFKNRILSELLMDSIDNSCRSHFKILFYIILKYFILFHFFWF